MNIDLNYLEKLVPKGTKFNLEYANSKYKEFMKDETMVRILKESGSDEEYNLILLLKSQTNLMGNGENEATLKDVLTYAITKALLMAKGCIPKEMEDRI